MAQHSTILWAPMTRVLQAATVLLAVSALTASMMLFLLLRVEQQKSERQRAELAQVKGLAIDTAETVVLQHRTIGMMIDSQKSLFKVVHSVSARQPAYTPYRTLATTP